MSTRTLPGRAARERAVGPEHDLADVDGKPTIVNMTSDAAATAAGESAHTAPRSSSGSARSRVRVKTVAAYPPSSR